MGGRNMSKTEIGVNVDVNKINNISLDICIVVDGVSSSIIESQVVPYEKIIKLTDLSKESTNEKSYASSANATKKIYDLITSVKNRVEILESTGVGGGDGGSSSGGSSSGGTSGAFCHWTLDQSTGELVSTKPVRIKSNLVVNGDVATGGASASTGGKVTVDTEMSDESENPVQNKVIKSYVDAANNAQNTIINSANTNASSAKLTAESVESSLASMWRVSGNQVITDKTLVVKGQVITSGSSGGDSGSTGGITYDELEYYLNNNGYITGSSLAPINNELESLSGEVSSNAQKNTQQDNRIAANESAIEELQNKDNSLIERLSVLEAWYRSISNLIIVENGNIRIKTNAIIDGDLASS